MQIFKGLTNEIARDSLRDRAIQSARQRQKSRICSSGNAPTGTRIKTVLLGGEVVISHSSIQKILRDQTQKPMLVDHPEEIRQMEALRSYTHLAGKGLYEVLVRLNLDTNWRYPGHKVNAVNLRKNVDSYLKREGDLSEES